MQTSGGRATGMAARFVHQLRLFFVALQFFTRIPVPHWVGFDPQWLSQASRYFPAVGLVVGAFASLVYALASALWPPVVAVLLSTSAAIWLTGAFHEDGFADTCDGFGGGATPERVLEIMKDSRIGAYGAIGVVLLLAIKCATLSFLTPRAAMAALLSAHPLSRLAATALIWRLDYVKAEGKAKPLAQHMSTLEFTIAVLTVALPLAVLLWSGLLPWRAAVAGMAAIAAVAVWMARLFVRRIAGYTGDCLGAVQQVSEAAFYLAVLAFASCGFT